MTAEERILEYTASDKWTQVEDMNWTTAEMLSVMEEQEQSHKVEVRETQLEIWQDGFDAGFKKGLLENNTIKTKP